MPTSSANGMPEAVFVDAGYILALVNENDQQHAEALALSKRFDGHPVVVTDAVLLEIGNALSRIDRDAAVQIIEDLRQSPGVTVEGLSPELFKSAFANPSILIWEHYCHITRAPRMADTQTYATEHTQQQVKVAAKLSS